MSPSLKRIRLGIVTGALFLGLGGTALAAPPVLRPIGPIDPLDLQAPDCIGLCTKLLKPGERLVVGSNYAVGGVTVKGSATGFGARFVVKRAPDLRTFLKVLESPVTTYFGPVTTRVPGDYRGIAINDSTYFDTTVTVTVSPN